MRLEEPEAKRQRPDLAGVEGDFEVPGDDWEFTLPSTATQGAASADQGLRLEAHEAASAVEQEEYVDDVCGTLLNPELVRKARQLELDWIKSREKSTNEYLYESATNAQTRSSCPCSGWTCARATRADQTTGPDWTRATRADQTTGPDWSAER
eukprot:3089113-Amphidinium_carterae.1